MLRTRGKQRMMKGEKEPQSTRSLRNNRENDRHGAKRDNRRARKRKGETRRHWQNTQMGTNIQVHA